MRDRKCCPSSQFMDLELVHVLIVTLTFMQNDVDEMLRGCCLICNSRTNNNNDVRLQNSSM